MFKNSTRPWEVSSGSRNEKHENVGRKEEVGQ